jgi:hypothetical protein
MNQNKSLSSCLRVFVVPILLLVGCVPKDRIERPRIRYDGPTEPLSAVVAKINQNNNRIKTVWASGSFEAWVRVTKDGKTSTEHFDGEKLFIAYRKPGELKLAGEKAMVGRLFEVGSNRNEFWMWIPYEKIDTMWWGEYRNAANIDTRAIPIRPDLLTEVLGVDDINPDLLKDPMPALRFNNDEDVYMITFNTMLPDRMIVQKEVWYDRATFKPKLVTFFDPDGRIVLRAYLGEHKSITGDPNGPTMASWYDLYFLQTGTKLVLKLRELKETNRGIPNDRTFRFPGEDAAAKAYRVDEPPPQ